MDKSLDDYMVFEKPNDEIKTVGKIKLLVNAYNMNYETLEAFVNYFTHNDMLMDLEQPLLNFDKDIIDELLSHDAIKFITWSEYCDDVEITTYEYKLTDKGKKICKNYINYFK